MLFALSFILLFSNGGLSGLILGAAATDIHVHDTHFVVGHFHYVMFGGTGFAFFAAAHYWLPKSYGRSYRKPALVGLSGRLYPSSAAHPSRLHWEP